MQSSCGSVNMGYCPNQLTKRKKRPCGAVALFDVSDYHEVILRMSNCNSTQTGVISNHSGDGGLSLESIRAVLAEVGGGFPKYADGKLFVVADGKRLDLETPNELFAWMGDRAAVPWKVGKEKNTTPEFFPSVEQHAERVAGVEAYPHEPRVPGHFYLPYPTVPGTGSRFTELLARFSPASEV